VYFDDYTVRHVKSRLIQGSEYYPFGMQTANSWTREAVTGNNYLANGGTELNATTQLYDLHYRNYDAALGRMFQLDPMASKYGSLTPYNYSLNNPCNLNDPLGDDVEPQPPYPREYQCAMCWREGDSKALYMMVSGGGGFEGQWSTRQSGINSANSFWHNGVIDWKRELKADAEAVRSGGMSYADYGSKYGATIYEKGAGIEWSAEIFNPWMGEEISRTADNTITFAGDWMRMDFGVMAKLMVKGYQVNIRNSMRIMSRNAGDPYPTDKFYLLPNETSREPFGALEYFWTGGNENGIHYDRQGRPMYRVTMGTAPELLGGPLRRGQQAIKLGKYLFNPTAFHVVKQDFLKVVGSKQFAHVVGHNPDITFKGTQVFLIGAKNGPFFGKSFETSFSIFDFIKFF
jgi:RHS repeat-associated protein